MSDGGKVAYKMLREKVKYCVKDIPFYKDMNEAYDLIKTKKLLSDVESSLGALK